MESVQKYTRIRANTSQLAKGHMQPEVTVDKVDPDLTDEQLSEAVARLTTLTLENLETALRAQGYQLIPLPVEAK